MYTQQGACGTAQVFVATSGSRSRGSYVSTQAEALYLSEVAERELLSADEEITLCQQIESGVAAARTLAVLSTTSEDGADEARLSALVKIGNDASQRLIESNLRFVVWVARRYQRMGLPLLDLVQEGNLGLHEAVWRFDWRRGVRFSTYAYWWIRQAIVAAIRLQSRPIRLPADVHAHVAATRRAEAMLRCEFGREPTLAEVAQRLGVSEQTVDQSRTAVALVVSLDEPCSRDCQYDWQEVIADERALDSGLIRVEQNERAQELQLLLDVLDPDQRKAIVLRFGLDGRGPYSVREVAEMIGLTRAEVRQLLDRAIGNLRRHARAKAEILQSA